ncbi:MAG: transposase [Acidobacteriota bacterium]
MKWKPSRWQESLRRFEEFFSSIGAALGRAERRRNAAYYIQGLLLPGERKSVEPLAERLRVDSQRLGIK